MSGAVEATAEYAEEAVKKSPEEEGTKSPEENKTVGEGGGTHIDLEDKEQVQQLGGADKTQVSIDKEPSSVGGCGAEHTHLMVVANEDDDSEKKKLQEKKVKKRKRSELQKIKQEKMFTNAQQPHLPCGAEQEHLLAAAEEEAESEKVQLQEKKAKKKKRSDVVKGRVFVEVAEPSSKATCPLRWCASYCTLLHHKHQKPRYNGSILLYPEENRVTLIDADETTIDCLQDWLKAADPKPISKDVEEEECLVFYQVSECHEETAAHQARGTSNANSENQLT